MTARLVLFQNRRKPSQNLASPAANPRISAAFREKPAENFPVHSDDRRKNAVLPPFSA